MKNILRRDDGNATIVAAGIIAAIAALAFVVAGIAADRIDTHRAQSAADLAAISGAFAHAYGDDGCGQARWVADMNNAVLTWCEVDESDVIVTVRVRTSEAIAKAGPL